MSFFNFRTNSISKRFNSKKEVAVEEAVVEESAAIAQNEASTKQPQQEANEAAISSTQVELTNEDPKSTEAKVQCQTVAHITSYPLIRETLDVVEAIPGVRVVKLNTESFIDPIVGFLFSNGYIQPVIKAADDLGNSTLGTVDAFVPFVKNTGYAEIGEAIKGPFVYTDQTVRAVVVATNDVIDVNILEPTKKLVHDTRDYYNKNIYDTKGKPLLRSSVDPIFQPINQTVEEFITRNLPTEGDEISHEFSSEIEKNLWLTWDLKRRSIPVITGKMNEVITSPFTYSKHVLDVFNDNLNKQEQKSVAASITATYNSSVDLVEEAWSKVADSTWNKVFKKTPAEGTTDPADPADPAVETVTGTVA